MVLKPRIFVFTVFLYFWGAPANAQAIYFHAANVSEEAANDLEWAAYHVNMGTEDGTELLPYYDWWQSYSRNAFQEFTLYNNSNTSHTVRFEVYYEYPDDYQREFLFEVNGIAVGHQIIRIEPSEFERGYYAFYDVTFPPNESTTVKVYNLFGSISNSFPNGIPRFTATISNRRLDPHRPYFAVEESWIRDICFIGKSKWVEVVNAEKSFMAILEREGSLANDFFILHKTNGNTWEIEFTSRFVEKNRKALRLEVGYGNWGFSEPMSMGWQFDIADAMTEYENIFLTNRQLRVLRNAIYARHGYVFKDEGMQNMFEEMIEPYFGQIYYWPNPGFTEDMLTETDRANIATIQRLEALAGD